MPKLRTALGGIIDKALALPGHKDDINTRGLWMHIRAALRTLTGTRDYVASSGNP